MTDEAKYTINMALPNGLVILSEQTLAELFCKGSQTVFGFAGRIISKAIIQLCCYTMKATRKYLQNTIDNAIGMSVMNSSKLFTKHGCGLHYDHRPDNPYCRKTQCSQEIQLQNYFKTF